ncbi:MAG: AbrB/MazE/SpoVT family DNA-binding domain-containing protein [Alphaproteobacteria bacterium]|jgi:antitoxin component of MazEF toxin-antitoxin module
MNLKIEKFGNNYAIIIPARLLSKLNLKEGDSVNPQEFLEQAKELNLQIKIAKEVIEENKELLKLLA